MKKIFVSFVVILFAGCASKEKAPECPPESEVPISACRAEQKCKHSSASSAGVGVGLGFGGIGFGLGASRPIGQYSRCFDEDMAAQKEEAASQPKN